MSGTSAVRLASVANGCLSAGPSSFARVASDVYWSSSSTTSPLEAWVALLFFGEAISNGKVLTDLRVWPVRGGLR